MSWLLPEGFLKPISSRGTRDREEQLSLQICKWQSELEKLWIDRYTAKFQQEIRDEISNMKQEIADLKMWIAVLKKDKND